MKTKYWFQLNEVFSFLNVSFAPHSALGSADWFSNYLSSHYLKYNVVGLDSTRYTATIIKTCIDNLMTIVSERHWNDYCVYSDTDDISSANNGRFMTTLLTIIDLTAPKYIPMLKETEEASKDLLAKVESNSSTSLRFNDTPQNGGDYSSDNHTTNISQSTSSSEADADSIMQKLEKIYSNFRSVILAWSNEFNRLFIMEDALNG